MTRGTQSPKTVTLHVPFLIVKRGGREEKQGPEVTLLRVLEPFLLKCFDQCARPS